MAFSLFFKYQFCGIYFHEKNLQQLEHLYQIFKNFPGWDLGVNFSPGDNESHRDDMKTQVNWQQKPSGWYENPSELTTKAIGMIWKPKWTDNESHRDDMKTQVNWQRKPSGWYENPSELTKVLHWHKSIYTWLIQKRRNGWVTFFKCRKKT